jgi:PPE-repeat protein
MVDFGALSPEYNSARMYSGPGSSSLQAAASAWNGLAAELQSAAQSYETVITQLSSDEWTGTASAAMATAAQPYIDWMTTTSAQAEQAANQARAAAAAYEQAFAATVAPPLVAANRAETAQAVAANVLGQYTALIAQLEAQYGEMWAQDAAAMYSYAGQSAVATQVTPFASPAQTTNPGGTANQAAAVSQATGTSAATSSQSILQQLTSSTPSSLQSLASPAATSAATTTETPFQALYSFLFGTTTLPTNLSALVTNYSPYAALFYNTEGLPYFSVGMGNFGVQIAKSAGMLGGAAPAAVPPAALGGLGGLGAALGGGASAGAHSVSAISGGAGSIGSVGRLAVPASWIGGGAPAPVTPHAQLVSSVSAAPEAAAGNGNLVGGMPLAGTGRGGAFGSGPRYGIKPTVMPRPPSAG